MTEPVYLSRRERRLAEQGLISSAEVADSTAAPVVSPAPPLTRRELRGQSQSQISSQEATESTSESLAEPTADSSIIFEISPSMSHEPQTNSIVIQNVNELTEISGVISDTGQFLRTGSIELPKLTQTGEIATVLESPAVDAAIHQDGFDSFVSSIAPVRATGVIKSQTKVGIMPIKNRRGQGQYLFALATSFLMLTVGALFVIAYMLGVFDK